MRKPRSKEVHCVVCGLIDGSKPTRGAEIISQPTEQKEEQANEVIPNTHESDLNDTRKSDQSTLQTSKPISSNQGNLNNNISTNLIQYLEKAGTKVLTFKEEDPAVEQLGKNMQQILQVLVQLDKLS